MELQALLERVISQLGYELVDFEMSNRGKLLRLFIDKPEGITLDDCVLVSNQVSHFLAVENDVDYDRLEVSSPGMDRVLKKAADFERFKGTRIKVKLRVPIEGRKNFIGVLQGLDSDDVLVERDGNTYRLAMANIDKARLDPEL
ncbi:ribosome maturation factor RimP [Novimethylophilus kurashikiensis]|uniref:Ribosome maturation factor RimP n=1 Tax=Novimethylophilus kurashikiensis TaxID=1825523 RepID=A0A2R5FJ67_9PROT|nr:ribosome maturation factor RimP [Novimethylophilus kurashikiensis]GBG15901.1 ribosome maturation factor RimP [Novimethylophilus kurashikiensis]